MDPDANLAEQRRIVARINNARDNEEARQRARRLQAGRACGGVKALSIRQPYAWLVMLGHKRWETRGRPTNYRGRIAIHAPATHGRAERALAQTPTVASLLRDAGLDPGALVRGAVLGTVELVDCVPTDAFKLIVPFERLVGDYGPGRWAWRLENPRVFERPIAARGALNFWRWPCPEAPDGDHVRDMQDLCWHCGAEIAA